MNWTTEPTSATKEVQRTLMLDLKPEEQQIVDALSKVESIQLNILAVQLNMPVSRLSGALFELELNGIVRCKPGGMYSVV
jgi:DNA processing protein